jgi:tetratricopeptide (TPR) repeat protein
MAAVATAGLVAAAAVMWLSRTRNTYLGDGNVLGGSLTGGSWLHPREPLTMFLHHGLYRAATALGTGNRAPDRLAEDAVAFGSVAAGVAFVAVAWFLASELARLVLPASPDARTPRGVTALVWLTLVAQGYAQLFFGYVENYTYFTLGVALYLWAALRYLRGAAPLVLPSVTFVLVLLLHVAGAVLVASFAVLGAWGVARRDTRARALRDLGVAAVVAVAARGVLGAVEPGYDVFRAIAGGAGDLRALGGASIPGYLASKKHLFDFVNEHLLVGPLGLWLFVPALALLAFAAGWRSARGIFFAAAGASYLGVAWLAGDSNLGYARNWDLIAPAGLVFTAAGLGLFLAVAPARRALVSALACASLVSLYHTAPWIATNASVDRSLARLQTLPLGMGRTEVLVSSWYTRQGQPEEAHRWLERAVAANPQNNNAHYLLGADYFEAGDMPRAADAFATAVRLRPDKVMFRQMLIMSLFGCGRGAEATPHLEFLLKQGPGTAADWALYGEALKAAGRSEEAQSAFRRAIPLVREAWTQSSGAFPTNLSLGQLYYNVGEFEEALPCFQRALAAQPDSDTALALAGYTLRRLGRGAESNEYFRRCLAINPDHPDHAEMEAWLGDDR